MYSGPAHLPESCMVQCYSLAQPIRPKLFSQVGLDGNLTLHFHCLIQHLTQLTLGTRSFFWFRVSTLALKLGFSPPRDSAWHCGDILQHGYRFRHHWSATKHRNICALPITRHAIFEIWLKWLSDNSLTNQWSTFYNWTVAWILNRDGTKKVRGTGYNCCYWTTKTERVE